MENKISKNFIHMIKYNFSTLILFELFHKGLTFAVTPAITYMFNIAMESSNIKYLSTDNIIKLLTNPISIILILITLVLVSFYVFFEFASIIIYFDKSMKYERVGLFELIKMSFIKLLVIFNPKNILLMVFILLIIPLTNLVLTSSFIGRLKVPEYIQDYINSSYELTIIYIYAYN